jgi:hypothetical protein
MSPSSEGSAAWKRVAGMQGLYFVATGLWPIVHRRSFELVTGPKLEGWLVKTVGALAAAMGATFLNAARQRRVSPQVRVLGVGSALAFAGVDVWYVARRRISRVYLMDAALELGLAAAWYL